MLNKVSIEEFAKVGAGQSAPQKETDFSDTGIPFIRAGHLEELLMGKDEYDLPKVNTDIAKKYRLKLYQPDTIIFAKSGMSATKGRVYKIKKPCYIVSHLATLELKENTNADFILYSLRHYSPSKLINDFAYPSIGLAAIGKFKIPYVDNIEDQIHIANILSKAEALIQQRKESIRLLDEFLKSTFLEMFGDPVRNEKGWVLKKLGSSVRIKHGLAFKSEFFSNFGDFVLLTPGNFYEEGGYRDRGEKQKYYTGEIPKDYLLKKDAVLIAMTEQAPGLLGSPIIVPESNKFLHNQRLGLLKFTDNEFSPAYLFYYFSSKNIKAIIHQRATGTKVRHTSPTKIEDLTLPHPPIELQNQFAAIVLKTEALKEQYQLSLKELVILSQSLNYSFFAGKQKQSSVNDLLTSNISDNKHLSSRVILDILNSLKTSNFTFDELIEKVKEEISEEDFNYEDLKGFFYNLLLNRSVDQYFDNDKRQIMFRTIV